MFRSVFAATLFAAALSLSAFGQDPFKKPPQGDDKKEVKKDDKQPDPKAKKDNGPKLTDDQKKQAKEFKAEIVKAVKAEGALVAEEVDEVHLMWLVSFGTDPVATWNATEAHEGGLIDHAGFQLGVGPVRPLAGGWYVAKGPDGSLATTPKGKVACLFVPITPEGKRGKATWLAPNLKSPYADEYDQFMSGKRGYYKPIFLNKK